MFRRRSRYDCTPWDRVGPFTATTTPTDVAELLHARGVARQDANGRRDIYPEWDMVFQWGLGGRLEAVRFSQRSPVVVYLQGVPLREGPSALARRLGAHGLEVVADREPPTRYYIARCGISFTTDADGRVEFVRVSLRDDTR